MPCCIFCKRNNVQFKTREHILPESLGGGGWAVLPMGLFCDDCQNKFGSEIEQQALGDYPLLFLRTFMGIPTKKGKPSWLDSWEGKIQSSLVPGVFEYKPCSQFAEAFEDGRKTQIRLLAQPSKPQMVCRFLLKMGIETVAVDNQQDVFHEKFDAARKFALTGEKKGIWWYFQRERMEEVNRLLKEGITIRDWSNKVRLEVLDLGQEQELFHLELLYIDLFTPLTEAIEPDTCGLEEPEERFFIV